VKCFCLWTIYRFIELYIALYIISLIQREHGGVLQNLAIELLSNRRFKRRPVISDTIIVIGPESRILIQVLRGALPKCLTHSACSGSRLRQLPQD
jgi:hypothetical protein